MFCVSCAFGKVTCIDTLPLPDVNQRRRRYKCLGCGSRFTTVEAVVAGPSGLPVGKGQRRVAETRLVSAESTKKFTYDGTVGTEEE